jgi:RNA polymerase sigma-70 factor (ECF subfamily)
VPHDDSEAIPGALLRDFIRAKAGQIIGKAGFTPQDRADLEQELALRFLRRWQRYDPTKGCPGAFLKRVGDRIVANLLRDQCARKRDRRGKQSLNVLVQTQDGSLAEWAQTISQEDQDRRLREDSCRDEEAHQLLLDLEDVLAALPPLRRELAELLKRMSLSAAARELGRSVEKAKISVALILRRFEEAGLRDYL